MRSDGGAAEHGSTEFGDHADADRQSVPARCSASSTARGASEPLGVPRVEFPQIASGAIRPQVLLGAVEHPAPFVEHLARRRARRRARREPARTATGSRANATGQHHRLAPRVLEHPAHVIGVVHAAGDDHRHRERLAPARPRARSPASPLWRTLMVRGWNVMPATPASDDQPPRASPPTRLAAPQLHRHRQPGALARRRGRPPPRCPGPTAAPRPRPSSSPSAPGSPC